MKGVHHSYALVDEVIAPTPARTRDEAMVELVRRFVAGHGPTTVKDFTRWATLTIGDTDGRPWPCSATTSSWSRSTASRTGSTPTQVRRRSPSAPAAYLFPTYDEAVLTYPQVNFPSAPDHPYAEHPDPFWAWVVLDAGQRRPVEARRCARTSWRWRSRLAPTVSAHGREQVRLAAGRLRRGSSGASLSYVENEGTAAPVGRRARPPGAPAEAGRPLARVTRGDDRPGAVRQAGAATSSTGPSTAGSPSPSTRW